MLVSPHELQASETNNHATFKMTYTTFCPHSDALFELQQLNMLLQTGLNSRDKKRRCTQIPLKNIFILNEGNKERASANRGVCNQYNQYSAIELWGFLSSSTTDWMQATPLLRYLQMSPATQRAEMKAGWSGLSRCWMSASSELQLCNWLIRWLKGQLNRRP